MQLRYRQQVTAAGVAVVALALTLGACSSSSSSSAAAGGSSSSGSASSSGGSANLSGTLNGSGSTLQLVYEQAAISAFKSVQSGMTVNYGGGGSGKGRTDLASGDRQVRGLGLADPRQGGVELQGQDGALLSHPDRPDHGLVQPVRRQQACSCRGRRSRASSRARSRTGTTRRSRRTTPASACPAPRSPSPSARTPRAPPRTSPSSSWRPGEAHGRSAAARSSSWPANARGGNGNAACRRSSSPPPGPSGTWTTPTPRPPR